MSSIKVKTKTKLYLDEHKESNINDAIVSLLDFVEPIMEDYPVMVDREYVVQVDKSTMERIKRLRTTEHESYNRILERLIDVAVEYKYDVE